MAPGIPRISKGDVKDQKQVCDLTALFSERDSSDSLKPLLAKPSLLNESEYRDVIEEEGWIVGAGSLK